MSPSLSRKHLVKTIYPQSLHDNLILEQLFDTSCENLRLLLNVAT